MNLNNLFNHSRFSDYAAYLKSTNLSHASIQRKLSSLSSFQKFLVKKKYIDPSPSPSKVSLVKGPKILGGERFRGISNWKFDIGNLSFNKYIFISLLLIIFSALGYGLYSQTILKAKKNLAYSTAVTMQRPGRILSFQGRLTDSAGNPIVTGIGVTFQLFNNSVGGTELYTSNSGSSQTVVPDENGIFNVIIGKTHGAEIPAGVFSENVEVWLQITAGGETMSPRQQIATVAYALNAETLQGLPPSDDGFKNTVMVIGESGNIYLGETSPSIISTSGTFGIEGQALLLKASDASGGNIEINPDAAGVIKLTTEGTGSTALGFISATNANLTTGNLYEGIIRNTNRAYNFLDFQNYNVGTTLLASRFSIGASGNVFISNNLSVGGTLTLSDSTVIGTGTTALFIDPSTNIITRRALGDLAFSNNVSLGWVANASSNQTIGTGTTLSFTGVNGLTTTSVGTTQITFKLGGTLTEATRLNIGSTEVMYFSTAGNVGIGTTNPVQKLHVEGQCVTGDTLLKRRRRKKKNGKWVWEWEEVPIKDIEVGDEILTLDEKTGKFVLSAVEALMDMGVQQTYLLITSSGKQIRTTGNHPYLVLPQQKTRLSADSLTDSTINTLASGLSTSNLSQKITDVNINLGGPEGNRTPAFRIDSPKAVPTAGPQIPDYQIISVNSNNKSIKPVWTKVKFLKPGMLLATIDGWETIVVLKSYAREQTYDIQVANTHNFVGNNIVAHNTFLNGNVGIGISSPAGPFQVNIGATPAFVVTSAGLVGIGTTLNVATITGIGSTALVTNLNADVLDGYHANYFVNIGQTGNFITTLNEGNYIDITGSGVGRTISFDPTELSDATWGSGSAFTWTLNSGATDPAFYFGSNIVGLSNSNFGIGTTTPSSLLHLAGSNSIFKIGDTAGNTLFEVTDAAITSNLPTNFTSSGDVSIAYDLNFTNSTASYIKSTAPLYLQAGETFNSSDLTLRTFNAGNIIFESANLWADGTNVGIGTTNPLGKLQVTGGDVLLGATTLPPTHVSASTDLRVDGNLSVGGTLFANIDGSLSFADLTTGTNTTALMTVGAGSSLTYTSTGVINASQLQSATWGAPLAIGNSTANSAAFTTLNVGSTAYFASNVGIGTTSPTSLLHLQRNSNGSLLKLTDTTNSNQNYTFATESTGSFYGLDLQNEDGNTIINFDASQKVGIATNNPATTLDINAQAANALQVRIGGYFGLGFDNSGQQRSIIGSSYGSATSMMSFTLGGYDTASDKMTILGSGNVGIGTINPLYKLQVNGSLLATTIGAGATDPNYSIYTNGKLGVGSTAYFASTVGIGTTAPGSYSLKVMGTAWINSTLYAASLTDANDGNYYIDPNNAGDSIVVAGNVGIGTTNPAYSLDINSPASQAIRAHRGNGGAIAEFTGGGYSTSFSINDNIGSNVLLKAGSADILSLSANNSDTPHMTITTTGSVGIGTTAPSAKLSVVGNLDLGPDGAVWPRLSRDGSDGSLDIGDWDGATFTRILRIDRTAGNVGIGTTNPGRKLSVDTTTADDGYNLTMGGTVNSKWTIVNPYTNNNMLFGTVAANSLNFITSDVTRMTILQNTGYVGIGTTNPSGKLQLVGGDVFFGTTAFGAGQTSANTDLRVDGNISFGGLIYGDGSQLTGIAAGGWTDGGANVYLTTSSDNVGIGTTAPGTKLDILQIGDTNQFRTYTTGNTVAARTYSTSDGFGLIINSYQSQTGGAPYLRTSDIVASTGDTSASELRFFTKASSANPVANMVINKDGSVGIGTTVPGAKLHINDSQASDIPITKLTNNYSNTDYIQGYHAIAPNMGTNHFTGYVVGQDFSARNAGMMGFKYVGAGSTSNYLYLGGHSVNDALVVQMTGNVGIGTTNPAAKLTIRGSSSSSYESAVFGTSDWTTTVGSALVVRNGAATGNTYSELIAVDEGWNSNANLILNSSGGNVGIGTTNPSALLELSKSASGTQYEGIRLTNTADSANMGSYLSFHDSYTTDQSRITSQRNGASNSSIFNIQTRVNGTLDNRLTINDQGNVGIGTTSPSSLLHLVKSASGALGPELILENSGGNVLDQEAITFSSVGSKRAQIKSTVETVSPWRGTLEFLTGSSTPTEKMRIDYSGYVGIGTTAPANPLDVRLSANNTGNVISIGNITNGVYGGLGLSNITGNPFQIYSSTNADIAFLSGTSEKLRMTGSGNFGIGTSSPTSMLYVYGNGFTGNFLTINDGSQDLVNISSVSTTFNNPTNFTSSGDVSVAYDLNFTNATASYIKSAAPLYLQAGETFNSSDLTLRTFNAGNIILESANLWADGTNVGIGNTNPSGKLHVTGGDVFFGVGTSFGASQTSSNTDLRVDGNISVGGTLFGDGSGLTGIANAGGWTDGGANVYLTTSGDNVGIGTTNPGAKLEVNGGIIGRGIITAYNSANDGVRIYDAAAWSGSMGLRYYDTGSQSTSYAKIEVGDSGANRALALQPNGGNVGIGTASPDAALHVNGQIKAGSLIDTNEFFHIQASRSGTDTWMGVHNSGYGIMGMGWDTSLDQGIIGVDSSQDIAFYTDIGADSGLDSDRLTGKTPKLILKGTGNVGIGTTNPKGKLGIGNQEDVVETSGITLGTTDRSIEFVSANYLAGYGWKMYNYDDGQGGDLFFATRRNSATWEAASLTIKNTGNVGIGTTNPLIELHVNDATGNSAIRLSGGAANNETYQLQQGIDGISNGGFAIRDVTNSVNRLVIQYSTGNVGIGNTNPQSNLHVSGGTASALSITSTNYPTTYKTQLGAQASAQGVLVLGNNGTNEIRFGNTNVGGLANIYVNNTADYSSAATGNLALSIAANGISDFKFNPTVNSSSIWHAGNDGSGSGLDADLLDGQHGSYYLPLGNVSGTTNYVSKFTGTNSLGNSLIYDNGTNVGIGTAGPATKLHVLGGPLLLESGGTNTYGQIKGYNNNNHFITMRGIVASDGSVSGGHQATWVEYLNPADSTTGWFFKDSSTAGYPTVARISKNDSYFSGNVGIGTTNPGYPLEVQGTVAELARFNNTSDYGRIVLRGAGNLGGDLIFKEANSTTAQFGIYTSGAQASSKLGFYPADGTTAAMTILQGGNVGIGTGTAATNKLHVYGGSLSVNTSGVAEHHAIGGISIQHGGASFPNRALQISATAGNPSYIIQAYSAGTAWYTYGVNTDNTFRLNPGADTITGSAFVMNSTGKVGIGTTNPASKLNVVGNGTDDIVATFKTTGTGTGDFSEIHVDNNAGSSTVLGSISSGNTDANWAGSAYLYNTTQNHLWIKSGLAAGDFGIFTGGTALANTRLYINSTGLVGIGTTNPTYKLEIVSPYAKTDTTQRYIFSQVTNEALASNPFGLLTSIKGAATLAGRTFIMETADYNSANGGNIALQPVAGNVGIGTTGPTTNIQAIGAGGASLPSFEFRNSRNAANNYVGTRFVNTYGNHSWGTAAEFRTEGASDRPSIIFTSTNAATTWGVGYGSGSDDKFRIVQDLGYPSNTWGTTRLSIDTGGLVGIGTTSPEHKLHVAGTIEVNSDTAWTSGSHARLWLGQDDNSWIEHEHSGGMEINAPPGSPMRFQIGESEKMRIHSDGNVGIGTTNPTAKLEIAGASSNISNTSGDITIDSASNNIAFSGDSLINITNIYASGNVGIGVSTGAYKLQVNGQPAANGYTAFTNYSDARLKENINYLNDGYLNKIMQLKPSTYNYNSLTGFDAATRQRTITGFIAQDLQKIFPEMVGRTTLNGVEYLDTNLSALQIYMLRAMQELNTKLDGLSLTQTGQINISYNVDESVLTSLGYEGTKNEIETAQYHLNDSYGKLVDRIAQFSEIASAKIKTGLLSATNIITKNIVAEKIISPKANIEELTSTKIEVTDTLTTKNLVAKEATISTLYADNIISKDGPLADKITALRDQITKLVSNSSLPATASASAGAITGTSIMSLSSAWSMDIASDSAKINGDLSLTNNLIVGAKLLVNGDTQLGNAFVTGTFTTGEIAIKDNLIETTNTALYIQPSAIGSVHILGDTLIIADTGDVTINGNLNLNGQLTAQTASISGSLIANMLTAIDASISGTLSASNVKASAFYVATDSSSLIIAEEGFAQLATSSAQLSSNATAGTATLPLGKTEIIIHNNKLTANSMVYLTPVGSTNNQVIYLKSKYVADVENATSSSLDELDKLDKLSNSFTIALDNYLDTDIDINWWIIN